MSVTIHTIIDAEDLARFRLIDARIDTARIMPSAYGREDIERALVAYYQLREEFWKKYNLPSDANWDIQLTNGAVITSA